MSAAVDVRSGAGISFSHEEFAALARLVGAGPLLGRWCPELSAAGWLAVVDGLAARGLISTPDGGDSYLPTAQGAAIVEPLAAADRSWSAIVEADGAPTGTLVLGAAGRLLAFEASTEAGTWLRPVSSTQAAGALLATLGLVECAHVEVVPGDGDAPVGAPQSFALDQLMPVLDAVADGSAPATVAGAPGLGEALAAVIANYAFESRTRTREGAAIGFCTWFDSGDLGRWRVHPSEDAVAVGRVGGAELYQAVMRLLEL